VRFVLLGPPGSGKGTQAKMLQERFHVPQVASGDLLRAAVKQKTPEGIEARRTMDRGALVSDDLVLKLVEERLREPDAAKGFVLDGFPRTEEQARALEESLNRSGQKIDRVVELVVPDDEVVKRISGRRTCRECGAMYHVIFEPPNNLDMCNKCNGDLYQREEEAEDTVHMRLDVYDKSTRPLSDYYAKKGLLERIDGVGPHDAVQQRILDALKGTAVA